MLLTEDDDTKHRRALVSWSKARISLLNIINSMYTICYIQIKFVNLKKVPVEIRFYLKHTEMENCIF